jgi:hypothetical protein
MICSHLYALRNYRVTARHTYSTTEVEQDGLSVHNLCEFIL